MASGNCVLRHDTESKKRLILTDRGLAMIPLRQRVMAVIPGFRARWRDHFSVMLRHLRDIEGGLRYGQEKGIPWIEVEGVSLRFFGIWTQPYESLEIFWMGKAFPRGIPKEYYRIVRDYVTLYLYPHLCPDILPRGLSPKTWGGFHGQHKETLSQYIGAEEKELRSLFKMSPDDVIINGGSFLGYGNLRVSPLVPEGHVYSVEAAKGAYDLQLLNKEYNQIKNVTILRKALWFEAGTVELEVRWGGRNTLFPEIGKGMAKQVTKEMVSATSIDDIVREMKLEKLDYISLTLNGAELEALKGAVDALRRFKPRIRLAGFYQRDGIPLWRLNQAYLEGFGYRTYVSPRGNLLAVSKDNR